MAIPPPGATEAGPATRIARLHALAADYWALTKPDVNFLIALSTFTGFVLGYPGKLHDLPVLLLAKTLVGTLLVAAGTGTLNQYIERRFDARMRRTARRPLAAGRISPIGGLCFGLVLSGAGISCLAVGVNLLASVIAAITLVSYLFLYTPVKRKTPLCVLIGAIPGAMPPLIGWAAATGELSPRAGLLYAILFLWQFPHFMAIAWMYREDYARAGYRVLPCDRDRTVRLVAWQTLLPALTLVLVSVLAALSVRACSRCWSGTLLLGLGFCYCAAKMIKDRSHQTARRLLHASIFYLPLLFCTLLLGRWSGL